jgi:hypothetical protein
MTTQTHHKTIVVLKLSHRIPDVIKQGQAIVSAMTEAKTSFPKPTPALSQVSTDLEALDTAETATHARTKGAVESRDAALLKLEQDLHALSAYVQGIVDAADPAQAEALVASAGMSVKKSSGHAKQDLSLHRGDVAGSVHVVARAVGHRAAYQWQTSIDGGKTWVNAPTTIQANTDLTGLPIGGTVLVRYMAVTKGGPGDWTTPESIVVS